MLIPPDTVAAMPGPELDPDQPDPFYVQVADVLRREIEAGQLTGRMPGEIPLSRRFEVDRKTIRRALDILRSMGLIRSRQGVGTFVIPR